MISCFCSAASVRSAQRRRSSRRREDVRRRRELLPRSLVEDNGAKTAFISSYNTMLSYLDSLEPPMITFNIAQNFWVVKSLE